ncbi:3-phosphoshikimate 1-carboxyvinyltransferase [Fulvivirga sedimenti]|uniref:3-phosphoshikimate 1-carboxyvinyltransferase n=1 Tax=Fulvivirga sedimenti TaxID=2879465 RepID=A0A9X1HL43_9BACT|nr:3-phosphoshikimate 1-carboxyvinyltransferase [Fulvivirga sedimenti]MCA6074173.1 3-phosphoshikimate 1-carboxyvinyltransferase [Fulvivirga sedimenti]
MLLNDNSIQIQANKSSHLVSIALPASKSMANRALIINALGGNKGNLERLSEARDTQTMHRLLLLNEPVWDVLDAGTTMRFLTAYAGVLGLDKTLTGTPRMQERPIGILVDALCELGANISYSGKKGYPPLKIGAFGGQRTDSLTVRGDISSQYISALLMIAPILPRGLNITLEGKIGSRPYIEMTRKVMERFGVRTFWKGEDSIEIPPQTYLSADITIERDWSAASYWYSIVALGDGTEVFLEDLTDDSIQGDRKMADLMSKLGVETVFTEKGAHLRQISHNSSAEIDFSDCPDIAQTIAVICAAKGIRCVMLGLESLRIKETDRIAALQLELAKIGSKLTETRNNEEWILEPGNLTKPESSFHTYHDHRMAMAFAPLAWKFPISIEDPSVVNKSYPGFWDDLKKAGAIIS